MEPTGHHLTSLRRMLSVVLVACAALLLLAVPAAAQDDGGGGDDDGVSAPVAAGIGAVSAIAVAIANGGFELAKDKVQDRRHLRDSSWRRKSAEIDAALERIAKARTTSLELLDSVIAASTAWARPVTGAGERLVESLDAATRAQPVLEFHLHGIEDVDEPRRAVASAFTRWMSAIGETAAHYEHAGGGAGAGAQPPVPDREQGARDALIEAISELDLALEKAATALDGARPPVTSTGAAA
jgi:hypothetical protein